MNKLENFKKFIDGEICEKETIIYRLFELCDDKEFEKLEDIYPIQAIIFKYYKVKGELITEDTLIEIERKFSNKKENENANNK